MGIDFPGRAGRALLLVDRQARISDRLDLDDAIILDDDVDRSDRWRPGAVDQRGTADDQPFEGSLTFAFPAIRCRDHFWLLVILGHDRHGERDHQQCGKDLSGGTTKIAHAHAVSPFSCCLASRRIITVLCREPLLLLLSLPRLPAAGQRQGARKICQTAVAIHRNPGHKLTFLPPAASPGQFCRN